MEGGVVNLPRLTLKNERKVNFLDTNKAMRRNSS